jgi:protein SCO1/2
MPIRSIVWPRAVSIGAVLVLSGLAAGCRADVVAVSSPPSEQAPLRPRAPTLALGAPVPDLALRNQDDRPIRLTDFRGRVLVATFLYTRCPFSDYCPRLMARVNGVRQLLVRDHAVWDQIQMVGITIDPLHDTPAVLRAYGESMMGDRPFEHLDFATGSPDVVDQLASSFGLTYREESGQLTHTLATALIDRDGRVANVIDGSSWSSEDLAAAIRALTQARRTTRP